MTADPCPAPPEHAEREVLAEIIRTNLYDDNTNCRNAATAILAASAVG